MKQPVKGVIALLLIMLWGAPVLAQDMAVLDDFRETLDFLDINEETRAFALLLSEQLPHNRTEDGAYILGALDAPVTIIEFADFACPHCQNYHPEIVQFITELVASGEAAYEFRFLPTAGGQRTAFVGNLLDCAATQQTGAFWRGYFMMWQYIESGVYYVYGFENLARKLAIDLNLDFDGLMLCSESTQRMMMDEAMAYQLRVGGTPTVFIRYRGDEPRHINSDGVVYNRGGVPFSVLVNVIRAEN